MGTERIGRERASIVETRYKVVPIVGNALINELMIGSHRGLIEFWANSINYSMKERRHKIARMTQFAAIWC